MHRTPADPWSERKIISVNPCFVFHASTVVDERVEQIFDNIRGWGYPQEDLDTLASLQLEYVSELDPDREESKLDPDYRCRTIGVELIHLPTEIAGIGFRRRLNVSISRSPERRNPVESLICIPHLFDCDSYVAQGNTFP